MMLVILEISDAMIRETCLPYGAALLQAIRESSFDELHDTLERNFGSGREQQVNVIGHDDKFMQQKFPRVTIVRERVDQEFGRGLPAEDGEALNRDSGDEEDTFGVHLAIVMGMREGCL